MFCHIKKRGSVESPENLKERFSGTTNHRLKFDLGIVVFLLPVHSEFGVVDVGGPRVGFGLKSWNIAEEGTGDSMSGEGTEFVLGDVQPTAMFGCVTEFQAANDLPGTLGFEGFLKRAFRVC